MIKTPEDFLKLHADAVSASQAMVTKTLESFEKLTELNLKAAGATLAQSSEQLKALLAAKDPQAAAKLISGFAKPSSDAFSAYATDLYQLSSKTGADLSAMAEKQIADGNRKLLESIEILAKNAPPGSEGAVKVLRNTVGAATSAYDQVFKATKQLAEQAEANLATVTKAAGARKAA